MKERPPLTSFEISHGICEACGIRLERDEPLEVEYATVIRLQRELFAAAREGNRATCAGMLTRALAAGFSAAAIMVGLVQPALAKIGAQWECGQITVADEHRFTAWWQTMLALLEVPAAPAGPLDILIVGAPGNRHDLGMRIAEQALLARDVRALAIGPELPVGEVLRLALSRQARWIGFSCALPHMVEAALEVGAGLVANGYRGKLLLSGQAVRRTPTAWNPSTARICPTIEDAGELILGAEAPGETRVG